MAVPTLVRPGRKGPGQAPSCCENAFQSLDGKTAHGLVRRSERYGVRAMIDSTCAGRDAGELLEGRRRVCPPSTCWGKVREVAAGGK